MIAPAAAAAAFAGHATDHRALRGACGPAGELPALDDEPGAVEHHREAGENKESTQNLPDLQHRHRHDGSYTVCCPARRPGREGTATRPLLGFDCSDTTRSSNPRPVRQRRIRISRSKRLV